VILRYPGSVAIPVCSESPGADRAQLELLRAATPERRSRLARALTATVIALARQAIRDRSPELSEREVLLRFAAIHYGDALAARIREHLDRALREAGIDAAGRATDERRYCSATTTTVTTSATTPSAMRYGTGPRLMRTSAGSSGAGGAACATQRGQA
jgi:hypothetical protein